MNGKIFACLLSQKEYIFLTKKLSGCLHIMCPFYTVASQFFKNILLLPVLSTCKHPSYNAKFELQVIDYYAKKGVLAQLHAENPPKEVTVEVQKVLSS